jgi:hypothetical protein
MVVRSAGIEFLGPRSEEDVQKLLDGELCADFFRRNGAILVLAGLAASASIGPRKLEFTGCQGIIAVAFDRSDGMF